MKHLIGTSFTLNSQGSNDIGPKPALRKASYEVNRVEKQTVQMSSPEGSKGSPCTFRFPLIRSCVLLCVENKDVVP